MRIGTAGSTNFNQLLSDAFTFRNEDYVVHNDGAFFLGVTVKPTVNAIGSTQLFNPVDSGVTVFIDQIIFTVDAAVQVSSYGHDAAYGTARGAWFTRKLDNSRGNALGYYNDTATTTGGDIEWFQTVAGQTYTLDYAYPIELAEGRGYHLSFSGINQTLLTVFYGREV